MMKQLIHRAHRAYHRVQRERHLAKSLSPDISGVEALKLAERAHIHATKARVQ